MNQKKMNQKKMNQKKVLSLLVILLQGILLMACSGLEPRIEDKSLLLQQRLDAYIVARENSDLVKMQKLYLDPGQARLGNIITQKCEIVSIQIDDGEQRPETKLKNRIKAMGFTFDNVPTTIHWIWHERDWYIDVPEQSPHPFGKTKNKTTPNDAEIKNGNKAWK